ncbi:hypothetical protein [Gordonia aichiensis]|uniref:hypothetical protein n=1 Tax=Gordonia aichiensis TaxID=36820 RepID=UPI0032640F76
MRLGSLVGAVVIVLGILFWAAYGSLPVPQGVRDLWDKAWNNKVEPAKEEWEKQKAKYETQTPQPQNFSLGAVDGSRQIVCTLPACAA